MDTEVDGLLPDEIMEVRLAGDDEEDEDEPIAVLQHEEMMLSMEPQDHVAIISVELADPAEEAATAPVEVMTRQIAALSGKPATVEAPSRASLATVVAAAAEPTPTVATQTLGQPHSLDTAQAPAEVAISRTVATLVSTATTSAAVTTRPVSTVSFATRPVTRTTEPVITMTTPSGQPITAVALSANHKGMSEGGGQVSGMALGGGQQVLLAMLPGSDQPILLTVQPRSEAVQQMSVPQGGGTASTPSSAASKSEPAPMMLTLQQGHGQTVQSSPGQGKLEQAVLFSTQGGRTVAQVQSRTQVRGLTAGGGKGPEQPIFLTVQGTQGKGSGGEGQQVLLAMPPGMTPAQGKAGEGQSVVLAVHSVGKTGTTQTPASSSSLPGQLGSMQVTKMAGPSHSGGSGPIITKFIIKPMPSTGRGTLISGSGSAPGTPTKTFTLSHVTTEGSPGRPQLGGKIAISPLKSPSKMTVMPMSPAPVNSPQKRVVTAMPLPLAVAQQILQQQQAGSPGKLVTQVKTSGQQGGVKPLSMPMSTMQPISVPGSKFHYVRLVTPVSTHTTQGLPAKPVSSTPQLRPPIPIAPAQRQVVARLGAPSPHLVSGGGSVVSPVVGPMVNRGQTPHRLIMPASSLPLRPSLPGLPPGTLLTPAAGYTMMPAQYITQLQQAQPCVSVSISKLAPLAAAASVPSTQTRIPVNGITTTDSASRPRKPCNCTKSQCLKLYCECFANGEFCYNCNCRNCSNNLVHESDRQRAIKSCLDRNPEAFRPKIGKGKEGEAERRHNKGCHCKRSGCLKNYCECYEAKIMCSSMCKCVGCKNFEESPERKTLMHLADAAEVRVLQQTAAKTKLSSQISDLPTRPPANGTGERLPFNFVTREVAEATCDCLLTVVDEVLGAGETRAVAERRVLQEFGRCLQQIINSAGKVRGNR